MIENRSSGGRPVLEIVEARAAAQTYLVEVNKGGVKDYEDFLALAGKEGLRLPQALGSLVVHYGQYQPQPPIRATHFIATPWNGWNFEASAARIPTATEVELVKWRRHAGIGPKQRRSLLFTLDDPSSGYATKGRHSYHPVLREYRDDILPLVAISRELTQDLLDITAGKP